MRRIGESKKKISSYKKNNKYTFLKYWRNVRYFIKRKYGLTEADLDILLYFYDEDRFTREDFYRVSNTMSWAPTRFYDLRDKGFIVVWREKNEVPNRKALYDLSAQAKVICSSIYKKLLGEEKITEDPNLNPIMKGNTYTDRVYRMAIRRMNRGK